ncbi:cytochrome c4 precursor [bacterium BMS3Abin11]|nr:cytochrome c4 precursor [bacterium BMS3Abin11]HDZ78509.1 c-type cytochrome [Gammaproteobacteria bacterium]
MTRKRKIIVTAALSVTGLFLLYIVGKIGILPVYGVTSVFQTPGTCSVCHETWYNEAAYAFNPKGNAKLPSSGVTIGCAECHPVQFEEYKLSAMGNSKNALRPGCVNCHDKTHSVFQWFSHMYLGNEGWTKTVQLALRDRELYNTKLSPHLATKARARFIETDSARCRECHSQGDNRSQLKGTSGEYRPKIPPHQEAKAQNLTCIQCHQNLTHNLSYPVAQNGAGQGSVEAGEQKSAMCAGCHGADGNSSQAAFPSIAGLNSNYFSMQLQAFKSGSRKNSLMQGFVAGLNKKDMADLAAYYSKQKMRPTLVWPKVLSLQQRANLEIGETLYKGNCARCHGLTGRGQGIFPALAGQHQDYDRAQMAAFKAGTRNKYSVMRDVAKGISDTDLRLIADYLAGLK